MISTLDKDETIVRCWMCAGDPTPADQDAQRAALCHAHERERIRRLMGLSGPRTPLAACRMVS